MPLEPFGRLQNFSIGAARLFDFNGTMTDGAYFKLYLPRAGSRDVHTAFAEDGRRLGGDFRRVLGREQTQPKR